jgi:hypothetical protein
MTASLRALNAPRPVRVRTDSRGIPVAVDGRDVETVREEWRVEEAWWTDAPVRRRYLEVVVAGGRVEVVFEDRRRPGTWYRQRG